ncbi:glycosyltransferase family 2 protein [Lactococcus lactis]|nr:glycosyltransferase family 2 protein [Lactococcus lactis]
MSTYNGEKFVAEQIESIQKQTFRNWNLIIRDDGSKDKTLEIIDEFISKDKRIKLIKSKNIGVINSFYELIKSDQADFYFFSDQDDYWLPEKLDIMLSEAKKYDNNTPKMYYSDLKVVDKNLKVINNSMIKSQSGHPNTELVQELTENTVTGGASMINHVLASQWKTTNDIIMHDWYLALLASGIGELIYIDKATYLYRQHDSNVLGARTLSKRIKKWIHPRQWFEKYWALIISSQNQAEKLLIENQSELTELKQEVIKDYVELLHKSRKTRRQIIKKHDFRKNKNYHTAIFRSLIITKFAYKGKNK